MKDTPEPPQPTRVEHNGTAILLRGNIHSSGFACHGGGDVSVCRAIEVVERQFESCALKAGIAWRVVEVFQGGHL